VPDALLRQCSGRGGMCRNLVVRGLCDDCQRAKGRALDARRGSRHERGYGSRWARTSQDLRRRVLRWCGDTIRGVPTGDSDCPQDTRRRVPSAVVDHIEPVDGPRDPNFWNRQNWQGLCARCHDRKRQRESVAARRG